ncbi:N-acetyltransferase [Kroppenstedtia pulmonis]|uniref:N-acetyltransferase n=1 Tax=Kroppenstedtia pulmonis TaxID=1380685 RepID=A0A7D3XT91_9BACL|nr:acyltransferase [Kroppenstedtia pulmonis]QKG85688.1 N-acetyltransferase [Kroppenstedtia pulmonis]
MSHFVDPSAKLGRGVRLGQFSVIEEGAVLGDNVTVGNCVTVHEKTVIGSGTWIGDNTVLGRQPRPAATSTVQMDPDLPALMIGEESTIGACAVLYRGSRLGRGVFVGDQAFIRETCRVGDWVVIGRGVAVENRVDIGACTKIQTNAYITAYTRLEKDVFIAPGVTTTNDPFMGRTEERFRQIRGPVVKQGARVGGGAILLPGVIVEEETFIAAGAVVNRDTEPATVYVGVPAKPLRPVPKEEIRRGDK